MSSTRGDHRHADKTNGLKPSRRRRPLVLPWVSVWAYPFSPRARQHSEVRGQLDLPGTLRRQSIGQVQSRLCRQDYPRLLQEDPPNYRFEVHSLAKKRIISLLHSFALRRHLVAYSRPSRISHCDPDPTGHPCIDSFLQGITISSSRVNGQLL